MKNVLVFVVSMLSTICFAQYIKVAESELVKMQGGEVVEAICIGTETAFNDYVNIGLDVELWRMQYTTSNVLCYLSANVARIGKATIQAKGGIGWGHSFTNDVTDHNFHTYKIGIPLVYDVSDRLSVVAEPGYNCRTYAEHIGFAKDRSWCSFSLCLVFKIGRKEHN